MAFAYHGAEAVIVLIDYESKCLDDHLWFYKRWTLQEAYLATENNIWFYNIYTGEIYNESELEMPKKEINQKDTSNNVSGEGVSGANASTSTAVATKPGTKTKEATKNVSNSSNSLVTFLKKRMNVINAVLSTNDTSKPISTRSNATIKAEHTEASGILNIADSMIWNELRNLHKTAASPQTSRKKLRDALMQSVIRQGGYPLDIVYCIARLVKGVEKLPARYDITYNEAIRRALSMAALAEDYSLVNLHLANWEDTALEVVDTFKFIPSNPVDSSSEQEKKMLESLKSTYKYVPLPRGLGYDGLYGVKSYLSKPVRTEKLLGKIKTDLVTSDILSKSLQEAIEALLKKGAYENLLNKPKSKFTYADVENLMVGLASQMLKIGDPDLYSPANLRKDDYHHYLDGDKKQIKGKMDDNLKSLFKDLLEKDREEILKTGKSTFAKALIQDLETLALSYTTIFRSVQKLIYNSNRATSEHYEFMFNAVCARVAIYLKSLHPLVNKGGDGLCTVSKDTGVVTIWKLPSPFPKPDRTTTTGTTSTITPGSGNPNSHTDDIVTNLPIVTDNCYVTLESETGLTNNGVILELEKRDIQNPEKVPVFKKKKLGCLKLENEGTLYLAPLRESLLKPFRKQGVEKMESADLETFVGYIN
jgi:hypothetical protein